MRTIKPYIIEERRSFNAFGEQLPGYHLVSIGEGEEVVVGSVNRTRGVTPDFMNSIIQPQDAYNEMCRLFKDVTIHGSMRSGSFLVQGTYQHTTLLGEDHTICVWMYSTCSGKWSTLGGAKTNRWACMNEMPAVFKGKGYFFRENHSTLNHNMARITCLLDELPMHLRNWEAQRQARLDTPMDVYAFCQVMRDYLDEEHKWDANKVLRLNTGLCAAFNHNTNANLPPSVERAVQAVSWLPSHGYTVQGTKQREGSAETQLKSNDTLVSISKYLDKVTGVAA